MAPTAIDIFSGAGGLSEGFIKAGFDVLASVESNKWAVLTQKHNHGRLENPTEVIEGRVETVPVKRLLSICQKRGATRPDVVMGGPPCQGFSVCNTRTRSMENPTNWLFCDFLKLVEQICPRVVLIENVVNFGRFNKGAMLDEIRQSLQGMAVRYRVHQAVLCAADYGVPQQRNRLFLVAVQDGLRFEFPEKRNAQPVTTWDAISDLPRLPNGNRRDPCEYGTPPQTEYQKLMRQECGSIVYNNCVTRNSQLVIDRYKQIRQGENWASISDELMTNYADKSRTHHCIYLRLKQNEPSVTITHFRKSMLIHPTQDRGLSVREAARLQSFNDRFVFCGPLGDQQQQVANAVPPLLARSIATAVRYSLGT